MHAEAYIFIKSAVKQFGPFTDVIEIGARHINGSARDLFKSAARYIGTDIMDGAGVDVVADGATYDPPYPPDCVVSSEVFEHTEAWPEIVTNAHRMLAPGGYLIATCASYGRAPHSAIDGGLPRPGEFYRNVRPVDMAGALHEFAWFRLEFDEHAGDLRLVARRRGGA